MSLVSPASPASAARRCRGRRAAGSRPAAASRRRRPATQRSAGASNVSTRWRRRARTAAAGWAPRPPACASVASASAACCSPGGVGGIGGGGGLRRVRVHTGVGSGRRRVGIQHHALRIGGAADLRRRSGRRRRRRGRRGSASRLRPRWLGATEVISSRIWAADSTPRSAPSRRASSAASIQSSRAVPGRGDLAGDGADAALEVGGGAVGLGGTAGREHDVGLLGGGGEEPVDRDHRASAGDGAGGQVGVREVGERVGAEQDEHVDLAAGRRLQDARWRRGPAGSGTFGQPCRLNHVPPVGQRRAAREQTRGEPHVERAVHVAAAQGAEEPHVRVGGVDRGGGRDDLVGGLGDVGAAEHDRDGAVGEQRRRPPRWRRASTPPTSWLAEPASSARTTSPAAPGRWSSVAVARSETDVRWVASSTTFTPSRVTAWRRRRKSTGSSSFRSGPSSSTVPPGAHTSSMVARGRPSTTSAGRPSPSWASTWSVPSTPLASLAQA